MTDTMWNYAPAADFTSGTDLTGWRVEATDGHIGKIDKHSSEVGAQYLVVDTGVWIFGKEVLLPAGTVTAVDLDNQTVRIGRTKDEIKNAPEFDKDKHLGSPDYHQQVGSHYAVHPGPRTPGTL
ncbi:PRC-barrel domain containing protein [Streptomyces sp. NPDC001941]|uniref:PRC-barrel domain containing protein n=1 Tax=Streptomyces sp. NPDC001941 TaxID=3154659 RepID=UPI00332E2D6A